MISAKFWNHGLKSVLIRVKFWLESGFLKNFEMIQTLLD